MGQRNADRERFWREAVEAQRRSGWSVREFCEDRGVSENSFYFWRRELERRDLEHRPAVARRRGREAESRPGTTGSPASARSVAPPAFIAVTVDEGAAAAAAPVLEIELIGGDRLRVPAGFDAGTLRGVIESLRGGPC